MTDYYAHIYADDPSKANDVVDDDFDLETEIAQINSEAEQEMLDDDPEDWEELT